MPHKGKNINNIQIRNKFTCIKKKKHKTQWVSYQDPEGGEGKKSHDSRNESQVWR